MAQGFLVPFAIRDGEPVHIAQVESGFREDCRCPECNQPLVARKGSIVSHHFAHVGRNSCAGETILHLLGKEILRDRIARAMQQNSPLPIRWRCGKCEGEHVGNLLKKARSVVIEKGLAGKVPDITLLGSDGLPCGVVEIVVTHDVELTAREAYASRKIPIVEIRLKSGADLVWLRDTPELRIHNVTHCPVPEWRLRTVTFAGLKVRLLDVSLTARENTLLVQSTEDASIEAWFRFDSVELAQAAYQGLKRGHIDGLGEPEWMARSGSRTGYYETIEDLCTGLVEFHLDWRGWGRRDWYRASNPRPVRFWKD